MVIFGAGTLSLAKAGLLTLPRIQLLKQPSETFRVYLVNEYNTSKASPRSCRKKTKREREREIISIMIMMRNRSATDVAQMFIQYEKGTPEFFDSYYMPICATSGCPNNKKHRDINSDLQLFFNIRGATRGGVAGFATDHSLLALIDRPVARRRRYSP